MIRRPPRSTQSRSSAASDVYKRQIIDQLKRLGASCDWERLRFTMDDMLSRAVKEVFVTLYEEGLIYKGKYIINWCPRCVTALANDEVEHTDENGHLWYIHYPFADGNGYVTAVSYTHLTLPTIYSV